MIKRALALRPGKMRGLGPGVFLMTGPNISLAIIKNLGLRLCVDRGSIEIPFAFGFLYRILSNKIILDSARIGICVSVDGVEFWSKEGVFEGEMTLPKPDFAYNIDVSKREIILGKSKFGLVLDNLDEWEVSPRREGRLKIKIKFRDRAKIIFEKLLQPASRNAVCLFKQKYFGIIDAASWDFAPRWAKNGFNALQIKNLSKKLGISARKVQLPSLYYRVVDPQYHIRLDFQSVVSLTRLGLSKVIILRQRGNTVFLDDWMTNVGCRVVLDTFAEARLCCFWGEVCLGLETKGASVGLTIVPFGAFVDAGDYSDAICCLGIGGGSVATVSDAFERLNISILHGFWVDVEKIVGSVNWKFLPKYTQFLLANMVLSFVITFGGSHRVFRRKIAEILAAGLYYALQVNSTKAMLYCKKILPLLRMQSVEEAVLKHILNCPTDASSRDGECFLSEVLGVKLTGRELAICPARDKTFFWNVVLGQKRLCIDVRAGWKNVRINSLVLGNIHTFNLDKLDDGTLITFD